MEPTPPRSNTGFKVPLLVNSGLVLVVAGLTYVGSGDQQGTALFMLFLVVGGLVVLNGVALLVAAITKQGQWVAGFALSIGLLLLIGLGTCGVMWTGVVS